ncbi:MAG: DUF445 family protein [Syntrophaceae bacterium]|nr:DUF445 family protein [Syntrophaceae bacterium]
MDFWHQITSLFSKYSHYLEILTMPLVFGFLGWFSNWKCIKMMFHPIVFWGIPPYLGWQGLIPRNAGKFAGNTARLLTEKLINIDEIFSRLDSRVIAKKLEIIINELVSDLINEIFESSNPLVWKMVPDMAREEIIRTTHNEVPKAVRLVIKDIKKNIFKIFDLPELATECMVGPNVDRMRYMFKTIGGKEFKFLEKLGFYIGFLLGCVQTLLWYIFPALWTVPIQSAIVGGLVNWIALQMVFRPLDPKKFLFWTYQGLFLRRREEVTKEFSKLVTQEVLNPRNIIKKVLEGREKDRIHLIIRISISQVIDRLTKMVKPVVLAALKSEVLDRVQHEISMEVTSPETMQRLEDYVGKALDIENTMIENMRRLTNAQFEDILRSIFKEDEWILIAVGVALGLVVGFIHAYTGVI